MKSDRDQREPNVGDPRQNAVMRARQQLGKGKRDGSGRRDIIARAGPTTPMLQSAVNPM